jgi:hypothetical protein
MPLFPLRIRFVDADRAYERFHHFPPYLDYVERMSRKRDGDSQVMLLEVPTRAHLQEFLALCRQEGSIAEVLPITEEEFWRAPSNAI